MQRKEIDRQEYEKIRSALTGTVEIIGSVTTIEGRCEDHGNVVLIRQAGRFFVDADDVNAIKDELDCSVHKPIKPLQTDDTARVAGFIR